MNTLREYLVSLGFAVDNKQYNDAMKKVNKFGAVASKMAKNVAANVVKGSAAAVSALATVTAATAKYTDNIAQADIETEKFARRMWMTEQNARSLQYTLKAMGEDMGSIYDVAANDELRTRFLRLQEDAARLEAGPEVDEALRAIRDVRFEWQRLQLMISYGGRYVAYYLYKYLEKPLTAIKQALKSINDDGQNMVKVWAERVARYLSYLIRLFAAGTRGIADLSKMINKLPGEIKVAAAAIALLGVIMAAPWLGVALAIAGVLLLLEDFYTWKAGGKSLFGDLWEELSSLAEPFAYVRNQFVETKEKTVNLKNNIKALWASLRNIDIDLGPFETFGSLVQSVFDLVNDLITAWDNLTNKLNWGQKFGIGLGLAKTAGDLMYPQNKAMEDAADKHLWGDKSGETGIWIVDAWRRWTGKDEAVAAPRNANNFIPVIPSMTMPVIYNPATDKAQSIINNDNHKRNDVQVDASVTNENTFHVTGSEPQAIANAIADTNAKMLIRNSGGWQNARIKLVQDALGQ